MQDSFLIVLKYELKIVYKMKNMKTYLKYSIFTGKEIESTINCIV